MQYFVILEGSGEPIQMFGSLYIFCGPTQNPTYQQPTMNDQLSLTAIARIAQTQGRRFGFNHHDLDELYQIVVLHSIRWAQANGSPPSARLIACIAKRRCAEIRHQRLRMPTVTDCLESGNVDLPTREECDPAVLAAAREKDLRVRAAVRALRANYRDAIERKYLRHHSDRQIAAEYGLRGNRSRPGGIFSVN